MIQTKNVKNYGEVSFIFNQTLEQALQIITSIEEDEYQNDVIYSPDVKSNKEDRMKELEEFKEYIRNIYKDCSVLATEEAIQKKYVKKKNGKFRKGATANYKIGENCGYYDTEFTNSWKVLAVVGKAISEKEITVYVETKFIMW